MKAVKFVAVFAITVAVGLCVYFWFFDGDKPQPKKSINIPEQIQASVPTATEYTPQQLAKLFNDNKNTKEAIVGKVVRISGQRTMAEASKQAFKSNAAAVFIDASPDGVTSQNIFCAFAPAPGGRFAASFLQWLNDAPDGSLLTIEGAIEAVVKGEWDVRFVLKGCKKID